jgi:hypothetical protein
LQRSSSSWQAEGRSGTSFSCVLRDKCTAGPNATLYSCSGCKEALHHIPCAVDRDGRPYNGEEDEPAFRPTRVPQPTRSTPLAPPQPSKGARPRSNAHTHYAASLLVDRAPRIGGPESVRIFPWKEGLGSGQWRRHAETARLAAESPTWQPVNGALRYGAPSLTVPRDFWSKQS